jgi:hypothetical protein
MGVAGFVLQRLFQGGFGGGVFALMKFFNAFGNGILSESGRQQEKDCGAAPRSS